MMRIWLDLLCEFSKLFKKAFQLNFCIQIVSNTNFSNFSLPKVCFFSQKSFFFITVRCVGQKGGFCFFSSKGAWPKTTKTILFCFVFSNQLEIFDFCFSSETDPILEDLLKRLLVAEGKKVELDMDFTFFFVNFKSRTLEWMGNNQAQQLG